MKYSLLLLAFLSFSFARAQRPGEKKKDSLVPQTFSAAIGGFSGKEIKAQKMTFLVDSALYVTDASGKRYLVESFDFTYRQRQEFTNDETGKPEDFFYTVQHKNTGNILPELWRKILKGKLNTGETIWFEKIIFKTADKLMLAPPLEIAVK